MRGEADPPSALNTLIAFPPPSSFALPSPSPAAGEACDDDKAPNRGIKGPTVMLMMMRDATATSSPG